MRRAWAVFGRAAVAAAVAAVLGAAPALADGTVVVRGTDFPEGRDAQLSFVGCAAPGQRSVEPLRPYIGRGPATPPAGERSLHYDLAGGNALGSLHYVDSMLATSVAGLSVYAPRGASGVAYAGFQERKDAGSSRVWFGRAVLTAPAGRWHAVDVATLSYTWTQYDIGNWKVLDVAPAATVRVFAATHGGDGAGLYTIGFGCDGRAFHLDALRIGRPGDVTTYDLEGLATSATMTASAAQVVAGEGVTLAGALRDSAGARLSRATMILEAKPYAADEFQTVQVMPADAVDPRVTVEPTARTVYRWRFVDRPLAAGSVSGEVVVEVLPVLTMEQALDEAAGVLRITGSLRPAREGATVTLWRGGTKDRTRVATQQVGPEGGYLFEIPLAEAQDADYFVTVPAGDGTLAGSSPRLAVRLPARVADDDRR
ncbi:hypothetical protein [Nocardioides ferulae]|uniref:hypothetical protein n=1 Tax=Nocardioides ferulae TaxID=2340821 RepID=UPI000F85E067|nr:hypothetical protein [Nocardioides ferulae]